MRKAFYILMAVIVSACSNEAVEPMEMGTISLSLTSDVEVVTKTRADAQDCSNFLVDIAGTAYLDESQVSRHFVYGEMPETIELPYGLYHVSAQSCTEADAEVDFGCVRYYGKSDAVELMSQEPVTVSVACKMANGKATVTFDQSFMDDFADVRVELTVGSRSEILTGEQANADTELYFNVAEAGSELNYRITATVAKGTSQEKVVHYSNATPIMLAPGKWARMTFKSNHNGMIGQPDINVNEDMVEDNFTETLDPDEEDKVGELSSVTVSVDTQIADATVIDCEIDVLK